MITNKALVASRLWVSLLTIHTAHKNESCWFHEYGYKRSCDPLDKGTWHRSHQTKQVLISQVSIPVSISQGYCICIKGMI